MPKDYERGLGFRDAVLASASPISELGRTLQELLKPYEDPMRLLHERLMAASHPIFELGRTLQELTKPYEDPMRLLHERLMAASHPIFELGRTLQELTKPYEDPVRLLHEKLMAASSIEDALRPMANPNISDVLLAMGSQLLPLLDVESTRQAFEPDAHEQNSPLDAQDESAADAWAASISRINEDIRRNHKDASEAIAVIAKEIGALRPRVPQVILTAVILPLLVAIIASIFNPIADIYIRRRLTDGSKARVSVTNALLKEASSSPGDLKNLRIVVLDHVKVRRTRKKRSAVVATLQAGDVVVLIAKRGPRALVGFADPKRGYSGYGWLLSKHLKECQLP